MMICFHHVGLSTERLSTYCNPHPHSGTTASALLSCLTIEREHQRKFAFMVTVPDDFSICTLLAAVGFVGT
jgi:hypothetical protein